MKVHLNPIDKKKLNIPKFEKMSTKIELGIAPLLSLYTHTRKNAI
jgi:hypothetical protein